MQPGWWSKWRSWSLCKFSVLTAPTSAAYFFFTSTGAGGWRSPIGCFGEFLLHAGLFPRQVLLLGFGQSDIAATWNLPTFVYRPAAGSCSPPSASPAPVVLAHKWTDLYWRVR